MPGMLAFLGRVATAPYAVPGTQDLARSISKPIKTHDAVLLSNHGSLTGGKTLQQALLAIERKGFAAQLYYLAHNLGKVNPLPEAEITR